MMRFLLILFSIAFSFCCFSQPAQPKKAFLDSSRKANEKARKLSVGKPFSAFNLSDGEVSITNSSTQGKVVYLYFGTYKMKYSADDLPLLNKVYDEFKNDTNFVFISLSTDSAIKLEAVKKQFNLPYNIIPISFKEFYKLNISHSEPANIILDKAGIVRYYECGAWYGKANKRRYFKNQIAKKITRLLNNG